MIVFVPKPTGKNKETYFCVCVCDSAKTELKHDITQTLLFGFQDSVNFFQLDVQRVNVIF